jgi:hypothetical protein
MALVPIWMQATEPVDGYNPENRIEYDLKEYPSVRLEKPPFYDGVTVETIELAKNPELIRVVAESMRENFDISSKALIRTRYKLEVIGKNTNFVDIATKYRFFTVTVVTESNSESVCRMYFHNEEIDD